MAETKGFRVAFDEICDVLDECLRRKGFEHDRGRRCAQIFAENSLIGVASHGLNRFPRFVEWIDRGWIDPSQTPERVGSFGCIERWDGRLGPGPLNAEDCMERTLAIADEHGVGALALRNTNHWMRAGTYAWQAAAAGSIGVCFTNTEPNLPPWGSAEAKLGNNPLAIAIPRANGRHVLFDGAMSQFSYGALEIAVRRGERLPVPGGFDRSGAMTSDAGKILESKRALPIGFWKGAGLSLMVDLLAATLSGGRSTCELGAQAGEYGVSQVFLAFSGRLMDAAALERIERTLADLHTTEPEAGNSIRYPGERLLAIRAENLEQGVPVDEELWMSVTSLAGEPRAGT